MFDDAYLIPLLPFLGFLINGLGRKVIPKKITGIIGSGVIFISFCLSILVFVNVSKEGFVPQYINYFSFIDIEKLHIPFEFQIDQLTSLFLLIITGVGFLIHVYSTSYMKDEDNVGYARYFSFLNLFVFSMLLLVMGGNYVIMFMGWEGVGLCSYLLIGFWFKNNSYNNAAKKAFIMNRIGDFGFILGIFWLINTFGTTSYQNLFNAQTGILSVITAKGSVVLTGISLLLFVGAMGKSAQIPLYTWLPDAMAGPTPVSALIHAATMVTAGIYMIARSNIIYSMSPFTMMFVAIIGLSTAVFAAIIALKQNDIKKVLAYSTVSQLGYMFLGLGVGAYSAAVFHVMTHAFFKALLFLGAGSVIHAMGGEQDINKMGGLGKKMKITYITFFIACLAIAGIPPFSGFFSKDEILAAAFSVNPLLYIIGVGGALLTAFYMFRLLALTFAGKFRGTDEQMHHLHESPSAITFPLICLSILSAIGGLVGIPEIFMKNGNKLGDFLSPVFADSNKILVTNTTSSQTEIILIAVSSLLIIIVCIWAWNKYKNYDGSIKEESAFAKAIQNKFYVDEFYDIIIVKPFKALSRFLSNVVEKSGIDALVNGVGKGINYSGRQIRLLQSGYVGSYILLMVAGLLLLLIIQLFTK
ncbi:NADH-quinone oxidoreductase subunit L [Ginsengibacter hankyongi]|uniref:NADH-quinone oxidoreductase subunit L n=1 Tax=Ginsengibacter hankyongi TaxID=2607284 RepID=A0A5J5IHB0_9BACT|nr:NADH-quinone oxidoreductase subunit L [Ginsengibacter hankyongi]